MLSNFPWITSSNTDRLREEEEEEEFRVSKINRIERRRWVMLYDCFRSPWEIRFVLESNLRREMTWLASFRISPNDVEAWLPYCSDWEWRWPWFKILQVSLKTDEIARKSIADPAVHKGCSDESLKTTLTTAKSHLHHHHQNCLERKYVVKAYQYTSITSIMLFDCWVIPCILLLTWLFLKTKYRLRKIIGVVIWVAGIGAVIFSDVHACDRAGGSNPIKGDALSIQS